MRSQDHAHVVGLKELFHSVDSELHDVILTLRVSNGVSYDTKLFFIVHGITPKQIHYELLLLSCNFSQVD
jgi:hypothetical protein